MSIRKTREVFRFLLIALFAALSLESCLSSGPVISPTIDTKAVTTRAAETLAFERTLKAGQEAVAVLTQLAQVTQTSPLPTATVTTMPTSTLAPATPTPIIPTNPPSAIPCNWAEVISEVTVEAGAVFRPGEAFTKTWRVKNIGSCSWTRQYELVFIDGDRMSGPASVPLMGDVQPGEVVDLSVDLIAPTDEAVYTADWMFRNEAGDFFGTGPGANEGLRIEIQVHTPSEVVFNFSQVYCGAEWSTAAGPIPCPGNDNSLDTGFVNQYDSPVLENGKAGNQPAIVTFPNNNPGGMIQGRFPAFRVRRGDHFRTVIGCFFDSLVCNVLFQLNYSANGGPLMTLDTWIEVYDGHVTRVDVDLSPLAGKSIQFVLTVLNNGEATDDWAFWMMPVILR